MVLSANPDSKSPFWYARVIGVYHAQVYWKNEPETRRINFLHVRWFERADDNFGDAVYRPERIRFVKDEDGCEPYGFLNPAQVIRAVHIIPAFVYDVLPSDPFPSELANINVKRSAVNYDSYYVNK